MTQDIYPPQDQSTEWTDVSFTNGWVDYGSGYETVQFRKLSDGRVMVRGVMNAGSANVPAFYLPAGFRPLGDLIFPAIGSSGPARVDVQSSGAVVPQTGYGSSSFTWFSVNGLTFDTT